MPTGEDIDWGNMEVENVANDDIDFSISLEESGIVVEDAGHDGGTATGNDALTVLDNPATRNDFIDQLFEVKILIDDKNNYSLIRNTFY